MGTNAFWDPVSLIVTSRCGDYKQEIQSWGKHWQGVRSTSAQRANNTRHTEFLIIPCKSMHSFPTMSLQSFLRQSSNHCRKHHHAKYQNRVIHHAKQHSNIPPNSTRNYRPYTDSSQPVTQGNSQHVFQSTIPTLNS